MSTLLSILKNAQANHEASATTLTASELLAARDWIKDCLDTFRDLDDESDVDDLSDEQVTRGIARHFVGGLAEFKAVQS